MLRATVKIMVLGLLASSMLLVASDDAQAWWGSRGGSHGSYGSYGCHGSYGSYGSYGGSYGSYGSRGYSWKAARRAYRASYYSCGSTGVVYSSYGSYGSGGSYGSYGSTGSYGSYGSAGGGGEVYYYEGDVYEDDVEMIEDGVSARSTSATLTVAVPADAKVYVNGSETSTPGSERTYVSSGLRPGYSYSYEVRVEATSADGETLSETQTVELQAGQTQQLAFAFGDDTQVAAAQTVDTSLTLHVPADAQVYLLGQETAATGETRTFHTGRLTEGQEWENYTIRVVLERDGEQLEEERTITLAGGEEREENFDFSAPRVASNR